MQVCFKYEVKEDTQGKKVSFRKMKSLEEKVGKQPVKTNAEFLSTPEVRDQDLFK